jgi:hypothetical protein
MRCWKCRGEIAWDPADPPVEPVWAICRGSQMPRSANFQIWKPPVCCTLVHLRFCGSFALFPLLPLSYSAQIFKLQ